MEEGEEIEQVLRVLLDGWAGGRVITVPLCERKRHTARHIASTPYVVLTRVGGGGHGWELPKFHDHPWLRCTPVLARGLPLPSRVN